LPVSRVVVIGIASEREVWREGKANCAIDMLYRERRRSAFEESELPSNRLPDHSRRDACRNRIQKGVAPVEAFGLLGLCCFRVADTEAAGLARPVDQVAVLVEPFKASCDEGVLIASLVERQLFGDPR